MNEESTREEWVRVNWTFDQAAQVAEHLRRDLDLRRVLFIMGGWIHRGYDNQHPDILPTAPECGGDERFAEACRRIRALGYLLGLHDNYQDMYRDAPSWDERYLMRRPDGQLAKGGRWAGGRAYLICSKMALELARRPQNLPAVRRLSRADAYFIDTTFAAGLQECFAPEHPLTRADDMRWKQALCDYARNLFGIFGSECGREWGVPHADFFEGLAGVAGRYYHDAGLLKRLGAVPVPLFEVVYRPCIQIYGKYGYDIRRSADYVLHHIRIGRPLHYHGIPAGLYWKKEAEPPHGKPAAPGTPDLAVFTRADGGWAEGLHPLDAFVKNTYEVLSPLNELTARLPMEEHAFLTADRRVVRSVFGSGAEAVAAVVNFGTEPFRLASRVGGEVVLPAYGFLVEGPTLLAFRASRFGGLDYEDPPLFVLRSLDGRPLAESGRVRVFHGFGPRRIRFRGREWEVAREEVLAP